MRSSFSPPIQIISGLMHWSIELHHMKHKSLLHINWIFHSSFLWTKAYLKKRKERKKKERIRLTFLHLKFIIFHTYILLSYSWRTSYKWVLAIIKIPYSIEITETCILYMHKRSFESWRPGVSSSPGC